MFRTLLVSLLLTIPFTGSFGQGAPVEIKTIQGHYYLSLARNALEKDMFLTTRVVELSGHKNISAGQTFFPGLMLRFVLQGDKLLAEKVPVPIAYDESAGYARAVEANRTPEYAFVFDVKSSDSERLNIDVTRFFSEEITGVCPLPAGFKSGKFEPSLSGILAVENLPNRVNIASRLIYSGVKDQFSAVVSYNLMLLDKPAAPRQEDPRVGYMTTSGSVIPENGPLHNVKYITRWRLEPRHEDLERYRAGEKVNPAKPIVFYMDPALPDYIAKYAKMGILDWNRAFEKIGFRDAIQVKEIPLEGDFKSSDVLVNMLRYVPNSTANAMGATTVDPRSGEIIQGDIYWFHNVVDLLLKWRFVQTAAVDPAARGDNLPEELLGEMIRYVTAHEMGHVLGLKHNMRGSYAYPVDSLRSPSFTVEHGTTASIMDYARFNYVAQPGDLERGVKLMPPVLGAYDYMAIQWGYGHFPAEQTQASETIFARVAGDPEYMYASSLMGPVVPDPSAQSDILGDDVILSSMYGIGNLKYIISHLVEWCRPLPKPYESLSDRYEAIVKQYFKYLTNSAAYIGGVYYTPLAETDLSSRHHTVDPTKAKEALQFVFRELIEYSKWLADDNLYVLTGNKSDLLLKEQTSLLNAIMKVAPQRILLSGEKLDSLFPDVSEALFVPGSGRDIFTQSLQLEYIARLRELSQSKSETGAPADRIVSVAAAYELSQLPHRIKKMNGKNQPHFQAILNDLNHE